MEMLTPVIFLVLIVLLVLIIVVKGLVDTSIENAQKFRKQFENSIEMLNRKIDRLSITESIQKETILKEIVNPVIIPKIETPVEP